MASGLMFFHFFFFSALRSKKRTVTVAPSLRSNRKVSSLLDKVLMSLLAFIDILPDALSWSFCMGCHKIIFLLPDGSFLFIHFD